MSAYSAGVRTCPSKTDFIQKPGGSERVPSWLRRLGLLRAGPQRHAVGNYRIHL